MSDAELRRANEYAQKLSNEYTVHHDARGWWAIRTIEVTFDGLTKHKREAPVVWPPKRTAAELVDELHLVHLDRDFVFQFYVTRAMREEPLDVPPPLTPHQRARIQETQDNYKRGAEIANEGMRRMLRTYLDKIGLTNIANVRKALK